MIRDGIGDTLGKRICYLRKLNKLTQEELAEVLCVKKDMHLLLINKGLLCLI